jgi:hypothetical protein
MALARDTSTGMTYVVDIRHWLDEDGKPAAPVRRRALRIARLIEYGGPLDVGYARETLVECSRRVNRRPCPGLLWVAKAADDAIEASCLVCRREELIISGWEDTEWAGGPMAPVGPEDLQVPVVN